MNRAERRKLQKRGASKESIYEMCKKEAEEEGWHKGVKHSYRTILLLTAYIAQMEFELDQDRLANFMDRLLKCIESFLTGQLTASDIKDIAEEVKGNGFDIGKIN